MKSVNFWLLANLIKHVDETFRGAAGAQEKRDPNSGDTRWSGGGGTPVMSGVSWEQMMNVMVLMLAGFFHLGTVCQEKMKMMRFDWVLLVLQDQIIMVCSAPGPHSYLHINFVFQKVLLFWRRKFFLVLFFSETLSYLVVSAHLSTDTPAGCSCISVSQEEQRFQEDFCLWDIWTPLAVRESIRKSEGWREAGRTNVRLIQCQEIWTQPWLDDCCCCCCCWVIIVVDGADLWPLTSRRAAATSC